MYERIVPRLGAASGALFVVLLFGPSSSGSDAAIVLVLGLIGFLFVIPFLGYLCTAPLLLVNGMFLDAEFGPAFLLFLLWTLLTGVVLTVRPTGVRSQAEPVAVRP